MEEKLLKSADEIKLLEFRDDTAEPIFEYPMHVIKRRKISIYLLLTVSAVLFAVSFSVVDFGISFFEDKNTDFLTSHVLGSVLQGEKEKIGEKIRENTVQSVLGIPETEDVRNDVSNSFADEQTTKPETDKEVENTETEEIAETKEEGDEYTKYPIVSVDLCKGTPDDTYFTNETGYSPDAAALLKKKKIVPSDDGAIKAGLPLVLIIHTHGTEAYSDEGANSYFDDGSDISRTTDIEKNVVAVGAVIAGELEKSGINTIHCTVMHDEKSYQESYSRAASAIKDYLAKYPSIKYVFDVHRDAILQSDGTLIKAVTEIDGENTAQVMTVVGSNYKGANFPDWEDHFAFALSLRKKLNSDNGNFCRPVYLRGAAYNEQYTPGSLLLEIGSSGNTLEEAKRAAKLVGEALAEMILSEADVK